MADFDQIVRDMKRAYNLRVRKWRKSMSGCAWRIYRADGSSGNLIESPYPRSPLSLVIFLHEVGHHVIGFDRYKTRCEEEYYVWVWAIETMKQLGVEPDEHVCRRFDISMQYAVDKAVRRNIKALPRCLQAFAPPDYPLAA